MVNGKPRDEAEGLLSGLAMFDYLSTLEGCPCVQSLTLSLLYRWAGQQVKIHNNTYNSPICHDLITNHKPHSVSH